MHRLAGLFVTLAILCGSVFSPASAQDKSLTVFAAASMKNALDDVDAAYTAKTGVKIVASYAASSALAKQIEQGAPADVFMSADTDWMDYAATKQAINAPTATTSFVATTAVGLLCNARSFSMARVPAGSAIGAYWT
jgi:molybdate transport system substrate-binding protein